MESAPFSFGFCVNEILACALDIAHYSEEENKMNKGGL
jgi:hypothetical protein